MYSLFLRTGKRVTSATLQNAISNLECDGSTRVTRTIHLDRIAELEAHGIQYSNEDFDVLSSALNFLDAVLPEHGIRR